MKRIAAVLAVVGVSLIGLAPAANALSVNLGPVHVNVLEPSSTPALVDATATNDAVNVDALTYQADSKPADPGNGVGDPGNGDTAVVLAAIIDGGVHVQSTKGLSRVTVVLCTGATVVFDSWDGEQLSADLQVEGTVEAVLIHSGDNTTAEAQALLTLLAGADAVKGNSTGAIGFNNPDACVPTTTTTQPPVVTTTTTAPPVTTTTTEPPAVTTTTTAPSTTVTTVAPPATDTPAPSTDVLGTQVTQPAGSTGDLPFTGSNSALLAILGGGLVLAGLILFGLSFAAKRFGAQN